MVWAPSIHFSHGLLGRVVLQFSAQFYLFLGTSLEALGELYQRFRRCPKANKTEHRDRYWKRDEEPAFGYFNNFRGTRCVRPLTRVAVSPWDQNLHYCLDLTNDIGALRALSDNELAEIVRGYVSLPKIISANNDCVVRRGLGWRGGFHIVVSVVAAAHPYPIQDACASHCNTPNTRSGSAADAVRQRSERDPNSRAVASRSDVQRTGSAKATSGRSGGHESPSFSLDS